MTNDELVQTSLEWHNHATNPRYRYCAVDDKLVLLRMNNFPDEPLWTLINGLEITDMEDIPELWDVKYLSAD